MFMSRSKGGFTACFRYWFISHVAVFHTCCASSLLFDSNICGRLDSRFGIGVARVHTDGVRLIG